ncbi:hypothetical protein E3Q10_01545 [Wallemia mellicola]|uniref:Shelterin complex subunit TPP1/Est3 domain-containing protein n=2 Tax=Wallemia mellicola TaxID=1708541 RepID=A0A4V4MUF3_9BASI|nr:hypothetical protein E3Q11_01366 [Wallemia mellicola]TIC31758.1 hypothetical protein E3Q10_01545 [Wallemia mellicola]
MDHYNIFEAPDILVNGVQTQNYKYNHPCYATLKMDSLSSWIVDWFKKYYKEYTWTGLQIENYPTKPKKLQLVEYRKLSRAGKPIEDNTDSSEFWWAIASDKRDKIPCYFTKSALENFETEAELRFTQLSGSIVFLRKWHAEIAIIEQQVEGGIKRKPHLYLIVDSFTYEGCLGEPVFGDPKDVMAEQLIVDFVRNQLRSGSSSLSAASLLRKSSIMRSRSETALSRNATQDEIEGSKSDEKPALEEKVKLEENKTSKEERIVHNPNKTLFRHSQWPLDFTLDEERCWMSEDQQQELARKGVFDPDAVREVNQSKVKPMGYEAYFTSQSISRTHAKSSHDAQAREEKMDIDSTGSTSEVAKPEVVHTSQSVPVSSLLLSNEPQISEKQPPKIPEEVFTRPQIATIRNNKEEHSRRDILPSSDNRSNLDKTPAPVLQSVSPGFFLPSAGDKSRESLQRVDTANQQSKQFNGSDTSMVTEEHSQAEVTRNLTKQNQEMEEQQPEPVSSTTMYAHWKESQLKMRRQAQVRTRSQSELKIVSQRAQQPEAEVVPQSDSYSKSQPGSQINSQPSQPSQLSLVSSEQPLPTPIPLHTSSSVVIEEDEDMEIRKPGKGVRMRHKSEQYKNIRKAPLKFSDDFDDELEHDEAFALDNTQSSNITNLPMSGHISSPYSSIPISGDNQTSNRIHSQGDIPPSSYSVVSIGSSIPNVVRDGSQMEPPNVSQIDPPIVSQEVSFRLSQSQFPPIAGDDGNDTAFFKATQEVADISHVPDSQEVINSRSNTNSNSNKSNNSNNSVSYPTPSQYKHQNRQILEDVFEHSQFKSQSVVLSPPLAQKLQKETIIFDQLPSCKHNRKAASERMLLEGV